MAKTDRAKAQLLACRVRPSARSARRNITWPVSRLYGHLGVPNRLLPCGGSILGITQCDPRRWREGSNAARIPGCVRFFLCYSVCAIITFYALTRYSSACRFTSIGLSFSNIHSYRTGRSSRVNKVEVKSPPRTTLARGRWTSAPVDVESAIGMKPKLATQAVISTGRSLRCRRYGAIQQSCS